jgi:hypothetical protein
MGYIDLCKEGPLVMEAPPMLQGILLDYWQRPIPVDDGKSFGDVGLAQLFRWLQLLGGDDIGH